MSSNLTLTARRAAFLAACALTLGPAWAQTAAPVAPLAAPTAAQADADAPRRNQKVENIHTEDSGARVDEVRYGGRTQSITVQPKANVPGYTVLPPGAAPLNNGEATGPNGNGPRVWNVLKF